MWVHTLSVYVSRSNPAYGDAPYVKQYAECGSPGLYIHLTPGYLLDDAVVQKWGRPGLFPVLQLIILLFQVVYYFVDGLAKAPTRFQQLDLSTFDAELAGTKIHQYLFNH